MSCPLAEADSSMDYRFVTSTVEKQFKIKWVVTNFSKLPYQVIIPGPFFPLSSKVQCRLELLKDPDEFYFLLHIGDADSTDSLLLAGKECEITNGSSAIFDIAGNLLDAKQMKLEVVDQTLQLMKTKPLVKLVEDTLVVICTLTISVVNHF